MAEEASLRWYIEQADRHEQMNDARQRDLFLVLAADSALVLGRPDEAERLRQRLLRGSPHHLLKPFGSFREAMLSADIQSYVEDLRRQHPPPFETSPAGKPSAEPATREPKVFRLQEPVETPPRPAVAAPLASRPVPSRTTAQVAPAPPRPVWAPLRSPGDEEENSSAGNWIAVLLFIVTLALGLGLAMAALVRPILLGH
jgi:hypothetical protein